jgi:hypothetical protein
LDRRAILRACFNVLLDLLLGGTEEKIEVITTDFQVQKQIWDFSNTKYVIDLFYYVNKCVECCISWCLCDRDVKNTLWKSPAFHDPKGATSTCQVVHILLHKETKAS